MEKKIFCLNKISPVGLKALTPDYTISEDINDADAVMVRSAQMHEMILPERILCVGSRWCWS